MRVSDVKRSDNTAGLNDTAGLMETSRGADLLRKAIDTLAFGRRRLGERNVRPRGRGSSSPGFSNRAWYPAPIG